jgi:hypothetical protein
VKDAKIAIECPSCKKKHELDLHLDPQRPAEEGLIKFPENNILECCGQQIDITGIRRQIEWAFGAPKPKK